METSRLTELGFRLRARFERARATNEEKRSPELVVTLTAIPTRYDSVHLTIASLMAQRVRPDRIVLWIGEENGGVANLPRSLARLQGRGLEIRERMDVGPHTKLYYALIEHPDSLLVTADDDRLYPSDWLEGLYNAWKQHPDAIHCYRAHGIRFDGAGNLLPYNQWNFFSPGETGPSSLLFPTGTGGVLYPPGSLSEKVLNVESFLELCPKADDVWFKAMSLLAGTDIRKVRPFYREFTMVSGTQNSRLWEFNRSGNDAQIAAVFDRYQLLDGLRSVANRSSAV